MSNKDFIRDIRRMRKELKRLTDCDLIYIISDNERELLYKMSDKVHDIFNDTKLKEVTSTNNEFYLFRRMNMPIRQYPLSLSDFWKWYMNGYYDNLNRCHIRKEDVKPADRPQPYMIHHAYRSYLKYNQMMYNENTKR